MSEHTMETWLSEAAAALDLPGAPGHAEIRTLLDLARDAAHQVERPAAPLTAFLVGVAVGRGAELGAAADSVTARLQARSGGAGQQGGS